MTGSGRISAYYKDILDHLRDALEFERPQVIQIALAKGIAGNQLVDLSSASNNNTKGKWEFQWSIMSPEYILLFQHLIIQKHGIQIGSDDMPKYMARYIELGLEILNNINEDITSVEELRFSII